MVVSVIPRTVLRTLVALLLLGLTATGSVLAQGGGCQQPSATGCPLNLDGQVQAVLADAEDAHYWRLAVPAGGEFTLVLTNLAADYKLYVYGPDRSLVGQSRNDGVEDETVQVRGASPGTYFVIVDSEWGEISSTPYRLVATSRGGVLEAATAPGPPAPGDILLADTFDDLGAGQLPKTSPNPAQYRRGYVGGEYQIQVFVDPSESDVFTDAFSAFVPGVYADASISVDARLMGQTENRYVYVTCRRQSDTDSSYRLVLDIENREFRIIRRDRGRTIALVDWQRAPAIRRGNEANRLELICAGNTIAAGINGTYVASVQDSTYTEGRMWVGVCGCGTADARFDNLLVVQEPNFGPPVPAATPPTPGQPVLTDNFEDPAGGWLPRSSADTSHYLRGYVGGEYQISRVDPSWNFLPLAYVPGVYDNAALTVDTRLVGDTMARIIVMGCREQRDGSEYRLVLDPTDGDFRLIRLDGNAVVALVDWQVSPTIRRGNEMNRVEFSCVGTTIAVSVNGTQIASVQDSRYSSGRIWIGMSAPSAVGDARFDNLVVTQR